VRPDLAARASTRDGGGVVVPADFTYDNRTGRGPGRATRVLGTVLPGVAAVWRQVEPYADAWRADNRRNLDRPGRRWVVLGDSLSQGVGASSHDAGWVGQLRGRLAADGDDLQVVNLSATGARVRDVLDQQLPLLHRLGPREDDLVTVLVGSNDLVGARGRRTELPAAFAELVGRLPPGAVVATLPQPSGAATLANEHLERAASTGAVVVVDLRVTGPRSWRGRLAGDFFHPNDAGYAAIATAFEPTVRNRLARGRGGAAPRRRGGPGVSA
jgi:lysophospholipase L1-like esterase